MSYSKTELRNEIAKNLAIVTTGQSLSTTDSSDIDLAIDAAVSYLQHEKIVTFHMANATADSIPEEVFLPLSEYVETFVAPKFGKPRDAGLREEGLKKLRRVVLQGTTKTATRALYY